EQRGVDRQRSAGHVEATHPVVQLRPGGLRLPGDLVAGLTVEDLGVHAARDTSEGCVVLSLRLLDLSLDDFDPGEDLLNLRICLARRVGRCCRGETPHDGGSRNHGCYAGTTKSRETSHT